MSEELDKLIEASFKDPRTRSAFEEKAGTAEEKRMSVGELVKGYPAPQQELDLHGKYSQDAMFELERFIENSIGRRLLTVRVITGKGLHSRNMRSVLPELTEKKLAQFRTRRKVLSFRKEKSGGSYVVYLIS